MVLPNRYITGGEGATASYDFYDLAARVGYKKFYGCSYGDYNTSSGLILVTNVLDSMPLWSSYALAAETYTTLADMDFDLTFSAPQIIGGTFYIQAPLEMQDTGNT